MKYIFLLLIVGCKADTELNNMTKPIIVHSKHVSTTWAQGSSMVVKDGNGKLHILNDDGVNALVSTFNVGDTIIK